MQCSCSPDLISKLIEKNIIALKIIQKLEKGEAIPLPLDPTHEIWIDNTGIRDYTKCQLTQLTWYEIDIIRFSKGKVSGYCNYLPQNHIQIENVALGKIIEFDIPEHNPYAFWVVLMNRCKISKVKVLQFPKGECGVFVQLRQESP